MAERSLLPPNSTPWERAQSLTEAVRRPLPAQLVKAVWNPWTCPLDLLPYLAWALGLEIWDASWPEAKQRTTVANTLLLKRQKTRPAGIKAYIGLVDCEVRSIVRPPARGFRIPAFTAEEWQAWLDRLPQIRVYPFVTKTPAGPRDFRMPAKTFRSDNFREASLGPKLLGKRATLRQNGVETPARIENVDGFEGRAVSRIFIGGRTVRGFRASGFRGHEWREPTQADGSVVTLAFDLAAPSAISVAPGLTPRTVQPVRVAERHAAYPAQRFRSWAPAFRGDGFRRATDAEYWVYDRIALHDPAAVPAGLKAKYYRGAKRYGIPDYTAILTVEVPMKRPYARGFGGKFRNGFRVPTDMSRLDTDMSRLDQALDAIVVAKALRDTVLVNTVTHRVVRLGDGKKLGEFQLGEIIRVA